MTKGFFNAQFGSLFRTDQNPTYLLRRCRVRRHLHGVPELPAELRRQPHLLPARTPLQHELPSPGLTSPQLPGCRWRRGLAKEVWRPTTPWAPKARTGDGPTLGRLMGCGAALWK